jgi:hypothetical protein
VPHFSANTKTVREEKMSPFGRHGVSSKSTGPVSGPTTHTVVKKLQGSHQRLVGRQQVYSYEGSYGVNSEGTWYIVTVRCGGRVKGTPMGALVGHKVTEESRLHGLISSQIDDLDQVYE